MSKHACGTWSFDVDTGYIYDDCDNIALVNDDYKNAGTLMAAAPDLLHELESAVARIELANAEGNPILSAWLPSARAAIAAAKGE